MEYTIIIIALSNIICKKNDLNVSLNELIKDNIL